MGKRKRESSRQPIGPAHVKLGKSIKDLRERRGKTLRDVESCSFSYLSDVENGIVTPTKKLLTAIVRELGGELSHFRGMLIAANQEHEDQKERMKRIRSGASSAADFGIIPDSSSDSSDKPKFEIVHDDDALTSEFIEPAVADPVSMNFRGPFVTEEIYEEHYVSNDRIVYKSLYNRLVRATEGGFQVFPWGFGETPPNDIQVSNFQLGVRSPATIERVSQIGHNAYAVDFRLPHPLREGERYQLNFFKIIDAVGFCDPFIGGSSAVDLLRCRIAVFFESGFEPARVWWFQNLTPYSLPGLFTPQRQLHKRVTGQYEKEFGPTTPGTMLGVAWSYDD